MRNPPVPAPQAALGVACRLGFATRVTDTPLSMTPALPPQRASQGDLIDLGTPTFKGGADSMGVGADGAGQGPGRAVTGSGDDDGPVNGQTGSAATGAAAAARQQLQQQHAAQLTAGLLGAQQQQQQRTGGGVTAAAAGGGGGVAVVVDAEATGYLMMGALSPGGWTRDT